MGKRVGFTIVIVLCITKLFAQDIHFSQFYVSPLLQNPANAGYFNCDYRITGIHRNQWRSVTVPYKTTTASYDMRFINRKGSKDILGAGVVLYTDKAGDADLSHNNFSGAVAYHKSLDRFGINYFGGGIMLSYGTGSVDFLRLRFPDQYGGDPGVILPTAQKPFDSFNYVDASMGLEYNWIPESKNNHVQVGAAIYHLNQPNKSFIKSSPKAPIYRKYVVHAVGQMRINPKLELHPKFQAQIQGKNQEYTVGTFARLDLDKAKNDLYGFYFGPWLRLVGDVKSPAAVDALILALRVDVESLSVGFSYDVNLSQLAQASTARGGPELSIIYIGCLPRSTGKAVYCPRF